MRCRPCALTLVLLITASAVRAERLPVRVYGLTNGLPSTFVDHILSDSRGLLWFSTRDGLARFDGSRFVTYGIEDGLPIAHVNFLVESRRGGYWVATNGAGVCRLDAAPVHPSSTPGPLQFRSETKRSSDAFRWEGALLIASTCCMKTPPPASGWN